MLVSIVKHGQLRQKIDKCAPTALVLIAHESGEAFKPISVKTKDGELFNGDAVTTFEIPMLGINRKSFDELAAYIKRTFSAKQQKLIWECVASAQVLTILYVSTNVAIPRDMAKALIQRLVETRAYRKYYSYWKREPAFSLWLRNAGVDDGE